MGMRIIATPRLLYHREGDSVPIVQEAGWAPVLGWTVAEKSRSPPAFDPRAIQPVASRYTD
jgi:hypothetical protein